VLDMNPKHVDEYVPPNQADVVTIGSDRIGVTNGLCSSSRRSTLLATSPSPIGRGSRSSATARRRSRHAVGLRNWLAPRGRVSSWCLVSLKASTTRHTPR